MIDFKDYLLQDLQKCIGKSVYIVHPGIGSDPYWGTIDSEPPHLLNRIIKGFHVSELGIEIITVDNRYDGFNINNYNIYFDEKSEKRDLNKLV